MKTKLISMHAWYTTSKVYNLHYICTIKNIYRNGMEKNGYSTNKQQANI